MSFAEIAITTDREQALDAFVAKMGELFPGWEAPEGDLLLWFAEWVADEYPDLANLAAEMSALAFRQFGEQVLGVPSIDAASATATTTWTLTDDDGHTIPEGTQVQIANGDQLFAFVTTSEVQVLAGDTATAAGEVPIAAILPGEAANGLTADPTLIDALSFVDSITLAAPTSGGLEAEDDDDFLDRLKDEFETLSRAVILPSDVATAARRVAGVERATVVDGYNPADDTDDNEKMVTVFAIDEDGENVSAGVKTAIESELAPRREVNFVFNTDDPTRTTVDVDVVLVAIDGADQAGLELSVASVVAEYLSPSNWGRSPTDDDPGIWIFEDTVRINELISLVDRVEGVAYVTSVEISESPAATTAADLVMDGPAPLPEPGDINVTVS